MNHPGEPHPLANPQSSLPILSVALPARPPEYERDEHDIDLKGYFNILYPRPTMATTALASSNLAINCARWLFEGKSRM